MTPNGVRQKIVEIEKEFDLGSIPIQILTKTTIGAI